MLCYNFVVFIFKILIIEGNVVIYIHEKYLKEIKNNKHDIKYILSL